MTNPLQKRAEESISARFTRLMKATTSRYGVLTDPAIVAVPSSIFLLAFLGMLQAGASPLVVRIFAALIALPFAVAIIVLLALSGARRSVIEWLASVAFPVENMNAVLNGLGEFLEVTFKEGGPTSAELNKELDTVHPDSFVAKTTPEEGTPTSIEIRIGVVDSKRNPSSSNHERYERVRALVDRVLVPLSERFPIESVRVK
jgi:hypothetical protein